MERVEQNENDSIGSKESTAPSDGSNRGSIHNRRKGHNNNTANVCHICGAKLKNRSALMQHKKNAHFSNYGVRCEVCGAKKSDSEALEKHMRTVHKIHVGVMCDLCGFTLDDQESFQRHMAAVHKINSGTMPVAPVFTAPGMSRPPPFNVFAAGNRVGLQLPGAQPAKKMLLMNVPSSCDLCGNMLPDATSLELHKRTVHSRFMNSSLFCDICGMTLANVESLQQHKEALHAMPAANQPTCIKLPETAEPVNPPVQPLHSSPARPPIVSPPLPPDIACLTSPAANETMLVGELPPGCLVRDLTALFGRYGPVESVELVCTGRAALVKYDNISYPSRLVNMAKTNPFFVGTTHVCLEFASPSSVAGSSTFRNRAPDKNPPSKILHFDISAVLYPVTVDVIKAICAPRGRVDRIFIGKKNLDCSLEALVEFSSIDEARLAKEQLDGADIYSGCCTLSVTFSRLQRVRVMKNDAESWDSALDSQQTNQRTLLITNNVPNSAAPLISGPFPLPPGQFPGLAPAASPQGVRPSFYPPPGAARFYPLPTFGKPPSAYTPGAPRMGLAPTLPPTMLYFPPPGVPQVVPTTAAPQSFTSPPPMLVSTSSGGGETLVPPTVATVTSSTTGTSQASVGSELANGTVSTTVATVGGTIRSSDNALFDCLQGVVLMITNVPARLNCDHLFNLLCLYGNVARIKFLKSRPGCALIQLGTPEASDLVHRYYDGVSVFGQTLRFFHSKQSELQEQVSVETLADGSPVMKTYMNDAMNRFRNSATKSRILGPSRTLHFFNAPLSITPDEICRIFTDCEANAPPRVLIFATKTSQNTSFGLVEWDTLSDALEALILANHHSVRTQPGHSASPLQFKLAFSTKSVSECYSGVSLIRYPAPPQTSPAAAPPQATARSEAV